MKTFVKLGLIGLALAASTANADVAAPSTGNGELTLFVRNDTTGAVYARGLAITMDGVLTQTAINGAYEGDTLTGATHEINYSIPTFTADANLAGFLNGTDSFSWTIMGGDSVGTNASTPDARRYLTTTQVLWGNPDADGAAAGTTINAVTNNNLVTWSSLNTVLGNVNSSIAGSTVGDGGSTASGGQWRQTGAVPGVQAGNWFGAGPSNINALGTAAHLYVLTTAGGGNGVTVRTYQGLDVILGLDGTLEVAAVPLPAAAWMLLSGLVTLAGVGRRRSQTGTPVAA